MSVKNTKSGFVIMYAVIISTVVLIMGVSLMNIVTKQLVLSSISRGAKLSYFAAISGKDCAEYWKIIGYFGRVTTQSGVKTLKDPPNGAIDIIGCPQNRNDTDTNFLMSNEMFWQPGPGRSKWTEFELDFYDPTMPNDGLCSVVRVTVNPDAPCMNQEVLIDSEGYNVSCQERNTVNPRRVKSVYSDSRLCD